METKAYVPEGSLMNFAQMLMTPVTPLGERVPPPYIPKGELQKEWKRSHQEANKVSHERAVAKFKSVMTEEWTPTNIIETRLGLTRSSGSPSLYKWEKKGIVERRKVGGAAGWTKRKGYEWRFVK
jgi:hypothetical protein